MKTTVVAGTGSGIGLATSLHLARNRYRVVAGMRITAGAGEPNSTARAESLPIEL